MLISNPFFRVSFCILMLLSNWVFIGNAQSIKPTIPVVKNGVIDLRNIPLDQVSVPISGDWGIYWNQLLSN